MEYDTIVIGAGSAGMSAAIYMKRFNMNVLVIGKVVGGLLNESHNVENYPGFASIPGFDLMMKFKEHCDHLEIPFKEEWVTDVKKLSEHLYELSTENDMGETNSYKAKTLILTMGTKHKKLGALNEDALSGRGVSYCATCDAAFYKNQTVAIVGGGDSAAQAGELVAQHASKIYMVVRGDRMKAEPINIKRLENNKKITMLYNNSVLEVLGDKEVTGIKLTNPYNGSDILPVNGMFVEIGHDIQSELAVKLGVAVNDHKEIIIDGHSKTNVEGIYAAGDVANRTYKQAITGAAEGVIAAFSAYTLLKSLLGESSDISYS